MSILVRNVIGLAAVYLALLLMLFASPDPSRKEADLLCDGSGIATAVFPDMAACAGDSRSEQGRCACSRPRSVWAFWYAFGVVPVIATVVGYVLLRGSLSIRLWILNLAVAAAIITETVRSVSSDPTAGMVVPVVPLYVAGFCAGVTALFAILYYARLALRKRTGAAT